MFADSNRTLLIASLATLATFLDTTILYVAFPDIAATFSDTGAAELSWVLNAYTIVFAALLIPAGKIADRIGHRRVFLTGSALFTVASMACGLAPTAELLIAFRIVQAVGAAALIPASLALVMHAFAHGQLPRAVAIWGAAGAVAGALGPTLGAAIVETLGWRWAFFINLPVGLYTIMAGRSSLHESSDPDTRVPATLGVVLVAAAAGLLSYAVVGTEEVGWLSVRTVVLFLAGGLVVATFIVHQRHTTAPVLDLDLFKINNFRWANLAMVVFGTAFSALFLGSILFLTQVWGWSILQAGFGVAPGPIIVGLVAPAWAPSPAGSASDRSCSSAVRSTRAVAPTDSSCSDPNPTTCSTTSPPWCSAASASDSCSRNSLASSPKHCQPTVRGVGGAALQAGRQFGGTFGVALDHRLPRRSYRHLGNDVCVRPDLVADRRRRSHHLSARHSTAHHDGGLRRPARAPIRGVSPRHRRAHRFDGLTRTGGTPHRPTPAAG